MLLDSLVSDSLVLCSVRQKQTPPNKDQTEVWEIWSHAIQDSQRLFTFIILNWTSYVFGKHRKVDGPRRGKGREILERKVEEGRK